MHPTKVAKSVKRKLGALDSAQTTKSGALNAALVAAAVVVTSPMSAAASPMSDVVCLMQKLDGILEGPEPPKKQKGSTKKKEKAVDMGAGTGTGTFVRHNEYGTWRTVPGFPPGWVVVSSDGWVCTRAAGGKGFDLPKKGSINVKTGYASVGVGDHDYRVHRLINRAFEGPCPPGWTSDHIEKYDGDWMRERSDNRASNVRWASKEVQRANQKERESQRNGRPIRVRADGTHEWTTYASSVAADRACGVKGLAMVANPDYATAYRKNKEGTKWLAEWAEPDESQEDLPPDPNYVNKKGESKPQPLEKWRDAIYSDGKPVGRLNCRVSNRGRAQFKNPRGNKLALRFTPKPTTGTAYTTIGYNKLFHVTVFCSFGGTLEGDQTVDHNDCDKTSNLFSNLSAESKHGQSTNKTLKPIEERSASQKHRIGARHRDWPEMAPTREFDSQHDAARALGLSCGDISDNIRKAIHKTGPYKGQLRAPTVGGYTFHNIVAPTPWELNWGGEPLWGATPKSVGVWWYGV